jgi:transcriptional regulator of arginine metabolism
MKTQRQAAILALIDHQSIESQEDLRKKLRRGGFTVTQATLSRDLSELGLVKNTADGAYHRPGADIANPGLAAARLQHAVAEFLIGVERAMQLVVLKTNLAQAQPLAAAVDAAALDGVLGSVAGEDTVLLVCQDPGAATRIAKRLQQMVRG